MNPTILAKLMDELALSPKPAPDQNQWADDIGYASQRVRGYGGALLRSDNPNAAVNRERPVMTPRSDYIAEFSARQPGALPETQEYCAKMLVYLLARRIGLDLGRAVDMATQPHRYLNGL